MQMKLWVICFNEWKQNFAEYCARTRLKAFLFVPPHTHRRQIKGCGKSRNHNFFFFILHIMITESACCGGFA